MQRSNKVCSTKGQHILVANIPGLVCAVCRDCNSECKKHQQACEASHVCSVRVETKARRVDGLCVERCWGLFVLRAYGINPMLLCVDRGGGTFPYIRMAAERAL